MTPAMIHYLRAALGMTRTQLGQAYLVLALMRAAMVVKIEQEADNG